MPELFHFQQPGWFWLLIPLLFLLWWLRQSGAESTPWRKVCDARLLPYLLDRSGNRQSRWPLGLLALGGLLAVLALADPVWEQQPQPVFRNEASRVIVLDLSTSMLSPDLAPSRLVRARYKVADILKQNLDGQTGLVVFAGDAFTVAPLTHDTDTIQALLSPLQPSLMPVQGSRVDLGLLQAAELMRQAGVQQGDILLLTDGFDGERALDAAKQVSREGYRVSVLGVGTDAGAPVPSGRGDFVRDEKGEIVLPALPQAALRQLAAAGGGVYTAVTSGTDDVRFLLAKMTPQQLAERTQESGMHTDVWQSNGPWLAVLLLPLAALAFRRGWLLMLVLLVGSTVSVPQPAMALGWDDLWLRPDQQATHALQAGEPEQAAQLAEDPALRGTAEYKAGNYEAALEAFAAQASADADYNQGNALAQLQRYKEAIAAYDQALEKQPQMADALHNKAEIEKLLQQQEQQQDKQQQEQSDQQEQGDQQQENADSQQGQQDQASGEEQQDAGEDQQAEQNESGEQGRDDMQASAQPAGEEQENQGSEGDPQESAAAASQQQQNGTENPTEGQQPSAGAQQEQDTAEAQEEQTPEQQAAEAGENPDTRQAAATAEPLDSEEQRAAEQWLRRIPDDPGGLLRRKFLYQYNQRAGRASTGEQQTW
jgi:Ca-activated chloride channel family protein